MQYNLPLACFLSIIRPPSIEIETAIFQLAPVDKLKCPFVKDKNDVGFRLYTRHNPTVYQELAIDDDEALFASHIDFHDPTVIMFHAFLEEPNTGSGIMLREAYILRGDTNVIMVDASRLEAGPWYFTAADNTWYIGRTGAMFLDYMVSRGLDLSKTHLIGHSLGAHSAAVAGATITSGRVSRITGLDPALPLFNKVSLLQQLDPSDAEFVDVIHTDAGIFGQKRQVGHVDFYPNGGQSPQPGCELEVVIPQQLLLNKNISCTHTNLFYAFQLQANKHRRKRNVSKKSSNFSITTLNPNEDKPSNDLKKKSQQFNVQTGTEIPLRTNSNINKKFQSILSTVIDVKRNDFTHRRTKRSLLNSDGIDDKSKAQNPKPHQFHVQSKTENPSRTNSNSNMKFQSVLSTGIEQTDFKQHRTRRSLFWKSDNVENENFLLRILDFMLKHRKSIAPVVSVVREVNTIVRNGNNEWNNLIKERNNYIGTLPKWQPVFYNFEVPKVTKFGGLFSKLFHAPSSLTVTSNGK